MAAVFRAIVPDTSVIPDPPRPETRPDRSAAIFAARLWPSPLADPSARDARPCARAVAGADRRPSVAAGVRGGGEGRVTSRKITTGHLERAAYVYIRQSSLTQVQENLESQRLQYDLAERARDLGWQQVEVIDEDLGRSGSGRVARPGFERLVSAVCLEEVGAVFALDASRLARNSRDWAHLVDLCGLTSTLIVDGEGIYDQRESNDRLLLGLKGTMSEWELSILRQRSQAALRQKAERGELYTTLPIGYLRSREDRCEMDPDRRIQEAIRLVFRKFEEMGSIRQVLLWFRSEGVDVPAVEYGPFGRTVVWRLPVYNSLRGILTNPIYAGAYAYGRTRTETTVTNGRARRIHGVPVPREEWAVLIQDHHEGYISWSRYEANQRQIAKNAAMKGLMSGRGAVRSGRALLAGLLRCRRCGRKLHVSYSGTRGNVPRYSCQGGAINHGVGKCISFGGVAVDRAVEEAVLAVMEPGSLEAALAAVDEVEAARSERQEMVALKLEQARYEAQRAHRQYDAVDPEHRLVADELERRWNTALSAVADLEVEAEALEAAVRQEVPSFDRPALLALAEDLPRVWHAPEADMRLKKRIVRTVIEEILADVDEDARRVDLVLRWAGGSHTRLQVRKNRTGQHRYATDRDTVELVRELARLLRDGQIAQVLNRLGRKTGRGNTWKAHRVTSCRNRHGIPVFDPETSRREGLLTLEQAAESLGVSPPVVRRLIKHGKLPGQQVVPYAPWVIRQEDLQLPAVQEHARRVRAGQKAPQTPEPRQLSIETTRT